MRPEHTQRERRRLPPGPHHPVTRANRLSWPRMRALDRPLVLSCLVALGLSALACTHGSSGGSSSNGKGKGKDDETSERGSPTPRSIVAGVGHTCVLRESGAV